VAGLVALAALSLLASRSPAPRDPAPDGELRLELNLPARRLDVSVYGEILRSHVVAVGEATFPTPLGSFEITRIIWNPWWYPPPSDWAAGKEITPPGPKNPMGRVKLYFRELYFIHGTPDTKSLGCAASHGCIRMANEDAVALARLVHAYGVPGADETEIDRLVANPASTRHVVLERPVPFEVVYRVAEVWNGELLVHPDIYRRVRDTLPEEILAALAHAGFTGGEIDSIAVESLARHAPRPAEPTLSVPLEAVVLPEEEKEEERATTERSLR